jgi:PAS domain S-box-containing protein
MKKNTPSNISNPQSLRVLMVEDSEDDALLIIRELKKGGYNPVHERVETAAAMKKALQEKQWDIILCDYKMPKFSGAQAISLLQETNIDIPLIIVSGTIGEETALECMRSGAHDYIMKNKLSRLCPAVGRELEEAEVRVQRKRMSEDLEESENKYRLSFENVTDVIYTIDKDLNILSVSPSVERVLGYKPQDFIGQPVSDLENILTPESFEQAIADISVILKGETISVTVYRFIAKD